MKINILEHPKPKSFFEDNIIASKKHCSSKLLFPMCLESIGLGIFSIILFTVAVRGYLNGVIDSAVGGSLMGCVALSLCYIVVSVNKQKIKKSSIREITSLSDADPERCLQIEKWLGNADIDCFINKVVTLESRKLKNLEVDAMEQFFNASQQNKYAAEQKVKIDAACKKIYFEPIIRTV